MVEEDKSLTKWVSFTLLASICFTISNEAMTEIIKFSTPISCFFYFSGGTLCAVFTYHLREAYNNYMYNSGVFWCDQNLISVKGNFNCNNMLGYLAYSLIYLVI